MRLIFCRLSQLEMPTAQLRGERLLLLSALTITSRMVDTLVSRRTILLPLTSVPSFNKSPQLGFLAPYAPLSQMNVKAHGATVEQREEFQDKSMLGTTCCKVALHTGNGLLTWGPQAHRAL